MTTDELQPSPQSRISLAERLGMHPELAIGYLGLLLFMIGDGVEAGFLSPHARRPAFHVFAGRDCVFSIRRDRSCGVVAEWNALRHFRAKKSDVGRAADLACFRNPVPHAWRCARKLSSNGRELCVERFRLSVFLHMVSWSGSRQLRRSATSVPQSVGSGRRGRAACLRLALCWPASRYRSSGRTRRSGFPLGWCWWVA